MNQELFNKILNYYHIDASKYNELIAPVSEENFAGGRKFERIEEAVELVNSVMNNNGKIFIYGDYDADGIMGTSILVKMFLYKDYIVDYYIPNRYKDGYGITLAKAQECVDNGVELVICVDNGVSAFEPIALLKEHGIKVLVLDHHEPQETLPNADVILHPQISNFSSTASSGAFVAFMFSIAFLGRFDKYLSTLASISTITDMMPLKESNRNLLRLVFANYQENEFLAIDALKENEPFDETTIGMKIGPKINSVGRLIDDNSINKMVECFVSDDREKVLNYINWINEVNELRKTESRTAGENLPTDLKNDKAIVYVADVKEGILGLIANQLCSSYRAPTIVFTLDSTGEYYKGSCRALEGFNVVDAFGEAKDLLVSGGGHALAGGCTIKKCDLEEFKKRFIKFAEAHPTMQQEKESLDMKLTDINFDNYALIKSFSPFGEEWPAPLFKIRRINSKSLFFSKDGKHILTQIGQNTRLVGFNKPRAVVTQIPFIDIIGSLKVSSYRGVSSIEFSIKDLKESAK